MRGRTLLLVGAACMALSACNGAAFMSNELGSEVDEGGFGNPTMNNMQVMTGAIDATVALGNRFAAEVPSTITFEFNSASLSDQAKSVLREQANFIRQFPEVRFKVYGHTDLVGSNAYNKALGLRRAKAAVAYLAAQGIGTARLEAVVSYGKTQPVIQTPGPEVRNRRTVTEVSGFVDNNPLIMNGKYAEVVWREYLKLGKRPHPINTVVITDVNPADGS